jgi:hypothetical protein
MQEPQIPHDQLLEDLKSVGLPEPATVAVKSEISAKVKTGVGVLIFENGILVGIEKEIVPGIISP